MRMSKRIREWLQEKNPSDRRIIILLFFLCLATFYGYGLWLPLSHTVNALEARSQKLNQDIAWLEKQAMARGVLPQHVPEEPIANLLKKEAEQAGFAISLSQNNSDEVAISANNIDAQAFSGWLTRLQIQHGINVEALEFHASADKSGTITLNKMTVRTVQVDKR